MLKMRTWLISIAGAAKLIARLKRLVDTYQMTKSKYNWTTSVVSVAAANCV